MRGIKALPLILYLVVSMRVNVLAALLYVIYYYRPLETLDVDGLVRLWAHEALRLFHDRLVTDEERKWTNENVDNIAMKVSQLDSIRI